MFFSEFVFFVLFVKGLREDHVISAELPGTKCTDTDTYLVSHNRTEPYWGYYIYFLLDNEATPDTCWGYCNKDVRCRSVTYSISGAGNRFCDKYSISVQELKDTGRDNEINTEADTERYPTYITYDRDCVKPTSTTTSTSSPTTTTTTPTTTTTTPTTTTTTSIITTNTSIITTTTSITTAITPTTTTTTPTSTSTTSIITTTTSITTTTTPITTGTIVRHCGQPSIPPKFGYSRIIGGTEATPGSWPWQISMKFETTTYGTYNYWCGGTIISDKWILTAAHCFSNSHSPQSYSIRVGDHNELRKDEFEVTHTISSIVLHENYNKPRLNNDIALMQVTKPIQFNDHVSPICLPNPDDQLTEGDYIYITGFGTTYGNYDNVLKQARVPMRDWEDCAKAYKDRIQVTENMVCAGIGGQDTCQGDSGGPLVSRSGSTWSIHGITSFGKGCADKDFPGVYAKVVNYLDWIEDKMA